MKIKLNGKEYDFRVTGTVGLMYMAERTLGEAYDHTKKYHVMALYHSCLVASNRGREVPDLTEFMASLTTGAVAEMGEYFWSEWERLEGASAPKEDGQGEG